MYRATKAVAIVLCAAWTVATARASDAKQARAETVTKADSVFRLHYTPHADQALRAFDKDRESGPADTAIYWFNANYVARLVFATDGSLARIELLPEALLYSDTWSSVPDTVELGPGEMPWFIAAAGQLRETGDPVHRPPNFCSYSGRNSVCGTNYERARVGTYRWENGWGQPPQVSLKSVTIAYKQPVIGVVSGLKAVSENEHQLMVGPTCYRIYKQGDPSLFDTVTVGSMVSLTAFGCAGNELACDAIFEPATPPKH